MMEYVRYPYWAMKKIATFLSLMFPFLANGQNTITPERIVIHGAAPMGFMPSNASNVQSVRDDPAPGQFPSAMFGVTSGQDMPNASPQAIEGYVYTYQSGLTSLAIGTLGHVEHGGSGTTKQARGVQAGVYITGSGGGEHAAAFHASAGRVGAKATGTYENGYGLYVEKFMPGFNKKYGVYVKDFEADNYFAGSVTIGAWTIFEDGGSLKARHTNGSVRLIANP